MHSLHKTFTSCARRIQANTQLEYVGQVPDNYLQFYTSLAQTSDTHP